jgi:hypothetical protein
MTRSLAADLLAVPEAAMATLTEKQRIAKLQNLSTKLMAARTSAATPSESANPSPAPSLSSSAAAGGVAARLRRLEGA